MCVCVCVRERESERERDRAESSPQLWQRRLGGLEVEQATTVKEFKRKVEVESCVRRV